MGHDSTYLSRQPLPTGRLWLTLLPACAATCAAVWLQLDLLAALLAGAGVVLVATVGLHPIRAAFAHEQSRLAGLLNTAPEGILESDAAGRMVFVNPALCALFGYAPEELIGQSVEMLVPPALRAGHVAHRAQFQASARSRPMGSGLEITGVRKDGTLVPIDISLNRVRHRRGSAMYCLVRDISARKAFERQLLEGNRRLTESVVALERSSFELRSLGEMGELLHGSHSAAELHGIVSQTMERLFPGLSGALHALADAGHDVDPVAAWGPAAHASRGHFDREDCWAMRRGRPHSCGPASGQPRCAHLAHDPPLASQCMPLLGHGELLGVMHLATGDPAQARELESPARLQLLQALANQVALSWANLRLRETLRAQSTIDPLTGIHNRRVLDAFLASDLPAALAQRRHFALLLLDIDHFKSFNDRFGHDCGDIALREVATLLHRSLRHEDILCRIGGEEFAVILPDTPFADAERIAGKLRQCVEALSLQRDGRPLTGITLSIGIAMLRPPADTAAAWLRRADRALYRAKEGGRNRVAIDAPGDDNAMTARIAVLPRKV